MKQFRTKLFGAAAIAALTTLGACGDDARVADEISVTDAISLVAAGVSETGSQMGAATLAKSVFALLSPASFTPMATTELLETMCDENGTPVEAGTATRINTTDERYPYVQTYCSLTINAGDTVVGGFGLARSLICTLEAGGIEFAGATQSIDSDFTDTECWPDGGPEDEDVTLSAVGSSPASFNDHFDKGVIFTVASLGLTFKIAANLDGNKIEFIAYDVWDNGNTGAMSGEINKSTGVLRFEKRDERIRADCADSSCGWNRHSRIHANLTMTDGEPSGLESFEYANSDTHVDKANETSGNHSGQIVTAKGALADEIKANVRIASVSGGNASYLQTPSNWALPTDHTACFADGVIDDAADCTTETDITAMTTNSTFILYATPAAAAPADWLADFSGFDFDEIDLDDDLAF